jgi:hypothetical protein
MEAPLFHDGRIFVLLRTYFNSFTFKHIATGYLHCLDFKIQFDLANIGQEAVSLINGVLVFKPQQRPFLFNYLIFLWLFGAAFTERLKAFSIPCVS